MKMCGLSRRLGSKIISGIGNDFLGEARSCQRVGLNLMVENRVLG